MPESELECTTRDGREVWLALHPRELSLPKTKENNFDFLGTLLAFPEILRSRQSPLWQPKTSLCMVLRSLLCCCCGLRTALSGGSVPQTPRARDELLLNVQSDQSYCSMRAYLGTSDGGVKSGYFRQSDPVPSPIWRQWSGSKERERSSEVLFEEHTCPVCQLPGLTYAYQIQKLWISWRQLKRLK